VRKLIIGLFIALLTASAIAFYYFSYKPNQLTSWSFVPDNYLFVYQPNNFYNFWKEIRGLKVAQNLLSLPQFQTVDSTVMVLDSLAGDSVLLSNFFEANQLLISYQKTQNDGLSALYIFKVKALDQHNFLNKTLSYFNSHQYTNVIRQYQGFTINEWKNNNSQFAYIFHKNFVVASFSPFLVEDAIRAVQNREEHILDAKALEFSRLSNTVGKIYFQSGKLNTLAGLFALPLKSKIHPLKWLSDRSYFDLGFEEGKINFSGFSSIDTSAVQYLSSFTDVRGMGFDMKNIVPQRSALVLHISFDDVEKWHRGLKNYWRKHDPPQLTRIGEIENKYAFNVYDFYELFADELGYFLFESTNSINPEKVFCIELSNPEAARGFFDQLAGAVHNDTTKLFYSNYANRVIGQIEIDELPSRIFGAVFSGFKSSFYTIENGYALIGNSEYALRLLIDDIDDENTWRKSVKTNTFLENTNADANLSVFIKTAGIWNILNEKLNDKWRDYVQDNKEVLGQIEYVALQFTNVDDQFYTNITLSHPGRLIEKSTVGSFERKRQLTFDQPLISKPYAVRNHNDQSQEMMVQDTLYNLQLISKSNEVVLTIPLKSQLISDVYQLDYYKNNKLQYLFAIDHSVHLIDRTGTYIPGYPVQFEEEVTFLSLIDYDRSKNYRIMVATEAGSYYLLNKAGGKLDAWKPKKLKGKPIMAGRHTRVGNTDMLLFGHSNGLIYGLDRRSNGKSGFPIDLKANLANPLFVEKGSRLGNTVLSTLTDDGVLVKFNMRGEITGREQLYREGSSDRFSMIQTKSRRNYILTRQTLDKITFIDQNNSEMFHMVSPSDDLTFQYYLFSPDNAVIIISDNINGLAYFYTEEGQRLHKQPLNSENEIAMLYHQSGEVYEIFCTYGDQFSVVNLKK